MSSGFERLTVCLPDRSPVDTILVNAGASDNVIAATKIAGLVEVPVVDTETTIDLAQRAVKRLLVDVPDATARIRGVVFAHSLPVPAPHGYSLVDEWLLPIGLRDLEVIAVSGQPCAILHGAIGLAVDWLKTLDESAALLVVGADVANHDGERCFFNSIMGDSAVAGLLTSASQRHRVLATYVETNIIAPGGELSEVDLIAKFRVHNAQYICAAIEACLAKAGLLIGDISLIAPHTPNRQIWDLVSELIRFPRERILTEYLEQSGHLNSNDSLAHYIRAVGDGRICQGERVLLVNPGFGGTRGCTLLQA